MVVGPKPRKGLGLPAVIPEETQALSDMRTAYYSESLKSWIRLERQEDGEWCHTSGFGSQRAALEFDSGRFEDKSKKKKPLFGASGIPSFLENPN